MLKKTLIALAVVALLAVMAQAGEIKTNKWPCSYSFKDIPGVVIPCYIKAEFMFEVLHQDDVKKKLYLEQQDTFLYKGCRDIEVKSNFDYEIGQKLTVTECGAKTISQHDGKYYCKLNDGDTVTGTATLCNRIDKVTLCVYGEGVSAVHIPVKQECNVCNVQIKVRPTGDCYIDP